MTQVQMIPVTQIRNVSNVRTSNGFDKESIEQLAASIQTHGLLQPILVRHATADDEDGPDGNPPFVIIAGRRRLAACKLAKMTEIPALVTSSDTEQSYQMEIAENLQREQMTLADVARAVRTLMMIYDNAKRVGTILNKSPAWISKHLTLTSSRFSTVAAELMDQGLVSDLETLLLVNQIAKLPPSMPRAHAALQRMVRLATEGNLNRQIARDTLASLKAPARETPAPVTTTTTDTKAHHETHTDAGPVDPASHFTVQVPIAYLALFEEAGGLAWLTAQLDQHAGK